MRLRNHIVACLEHAAQISSEPERSPWLTFVIVDGGPTGVEFTGALFELLTLVLGREYRELAPASARVVPVEGTGRLLLTFPPRLSRYAQRVLEHRGVEVVTGTLAREAGPDGVKLSNRRRVASRTVVWSAGIRAAHVDGASQLARSASGRLLTDEWLHPSGRRDVFVVGDLASARVDNGELPMLSPPAMQEGGYVARVILDAERGRSTSRPFHYRDRGTMAVIGRNAAVARLWRTSLTGQVGWLTRLIVHLYYLVGFRNRTAVLVNWAWNYLRKDRPIRMITRVDPDPSPTSSPACPAV